MARPAIVRRIARALPSPRQSEVLQFMHAFREQRTRYPNAVEIQNELGITHRAVFDLLQRLKERGYLTWTPGDSATLTVANFTLPFIGTVQ